MVLAARHQPILLGFVFLQIVYRGHSASDYNRKDGSELQTPSLIARQEGDRVLLRCHSNNNNNNNNNGKQEHIVWQYMPLNATDDWQFVKCSGKSACKSTLNLGTVTFEEEGFYRCSQRLKLLKIYKLTIVGGPAQLPNLPLDSDNAPDLVERLPDKPVRVYRPAGGEVELECKVKLYTSRMNSIKWYYKKCATRREVSPCSKFEDDFDHSDWMVVTCGGENCSNLTLELKPTEEDNGLYRCSFKNDIVVTYELEVIDKVSGGSEIVEVTPYNASVILGSSAPFQCFVHSKVKPHIIWFRRRNARYEDTRFTPSFITYLNDSYEQMTSHQVGFRDDVYLSKLVISDTRLSDSGVYVCVAVNSFNETHKEAYLTVLPKYFRDEEADVSDSSLHWLFLIPAGLALIPVTAWFFCLYKRKKADINQSQNNINNNLQPQQGFKYKPVIKAQE